MMNTMKPNMKIYRQILLAILVVCLGAVSCKKDKTDDENLPYLTGTLSFSVPTYVMPGQTFHLIPSTISKEEEGEPGIYWSLSELSYRDTTRYENGIGDGSFDLIIPTNKTSLTVTCVAFAEGYTPTSKSVTLVIVKGAESITGLGLPDDVATITDARDDRTYPYVTIGAQDWMARNLAYSSGKPYYNAAAMQDVFGMFYTWDEAVSACPDGWRLPTSSDWDALAKAHGCEDVSEVYAGIAGDMMADAYMNDSKMWEFWPEVKIANTLKFCAIPAGYAVEAEDKAVFTNSAGYAVFWTAEEAGEDQAWVRQLYVRSPDVQKASMYKSNFRGSVRCVRDASSD